MTTQDSALDNDEAITADDLATIRRSLQAETERLRGRGDRPGQPSSPPDDGGDRLDLSERLDERGYTTVLAANTAAILADCVAALSRLDSGTYGLCEQCGETIDRFRLLAFPRARLCLRCKTGRSRPGRAS